MDSNALRKHGKEMIDIVADYWDDMRSRRPLPDIKPGFINDMVPQEAPLEPEDWQKIFQDVENVVLDKNTHWHHPHFFSYYPTANSYPAVIGDILSTSIASIGFTWKSSPSMTELEMMMVDWLAKALGLPEFFLHSSEGPGAGIIQSTASDATLVAILSARARAVVTFKRNNPVSKTYETISKAFSAVQTWIQGKPVTDDDVITFDSHDASIFPNLVAYCSDQAHSSVDKDIMLTGVKMRKLKTTIGGPLGNYFVSPKTLEEAIKKDRSNGLIPFILIATVGSTNTCAVDPLELLGPICNKENIWLHVDAAYAGSFALCPEYRYILNGVEFVDSFNFNAHKVLLVNFDCSPMWFKNAQEATRYFNVEAEYLKHEYQNVASDFRHLQVALGRRFRSLKIWFVFRSLGITYIQQTLRNRVRLANKFSQLIISDDNYELIVPAHLGLVCFRHNSDNPTNERLISTINDDGRIHLVPGKIDGKLFIRFVVCSTQTTDDDVLYAFNVINEVLARVIAAR